MTTVAVVFLVWAIIATAFLVTQREWGLSQRRLYLDERQDCRSLARFFTQERLKRIYWEARCVKAETDAAMWRTLFLRAAANELKASAESNGHGLELVKDEPA
jgi:hypothetical protein